MCSAISSRSAPITRASLSKPPHNELFIHRQTLANVMRFATPELAELEARITTAADRALALELEIFSNQPAQFSPSKTRSPPRARRLPRSIIMPASPNWRSSRIIVARISIRAVCSPSRMAATRWS